MKALLIQADQARKVEVIEIQGRDDLRKHVGGIPEPTRYDSDALMFVSDTGRLDGKPMNVRATAYIRHESDAAWERGGLLTQDDSYGLFGDVVVVGDGGPAGMRDVPDRLVKRFGADIPLQVDHDNQSRRSIRGDEDGMLRIPWRGDPESGGRMWHLPLGINLGSRSPPLRARSQPSTSTTGATGAKGNLPHRNQAQSNSGTTSSRTPTFDRADSLPSALILTTTSWTWRRRSDTHAGQSPPPSTMRWEPPSGPPMPTAREELLPSQATTRCSKGRGKHRNIGVVRGDVESGQRIVGSTPHTVADEDLRNVVNLASEIEDIAPAERASLDRLETELDPPSFEPPSFERDEGNG